MENNLFEMLSAIMGKSNNQNQQTNAVPPEHQVHAESYYPQEAYPSSQPQNQQSGNYATNNNYDNTNAGNGMNNSLLPMLMSLMGQNGSQLGALSKIFGGDASGMANLLKPQKNNQTESDVVVEEQPSPQDDILL